ncbi:MAG: hypothetical protein H0W53_10840 [Acidobacteria bacterium]|nr:hypothetical protein [Acidobacteriota bacterium]
MAFGVEPRIPLRQQGTNTIWVAASSVSMFWTRRPARGTFSVIPKRR